MGQYDVSNVRKEEYDRIREGYDALIGMLRENGIDPSSGIQGLVEERDGLLAMIYEAVNGITCLCSEGLEFMSKMELARAVLKDLKPLTDVASKRGC